MPIIPVRVPQIQKNSNLQRRCPCQLTQEGVWHLCLDDDQDDGRRACRSTSRGPVRARRGPTGIRILVVHPYGSIESSVRARWGPSGDIGHIGQSLVKSKNIKFGPKSDENRPFGPKQRPNESCGLSGPIRTTTEAKNGKKHVFFVCSLQENSPRRPRRTSAAPLTPSGAGRGLR